MYQQAGARSGLQAAVTDSWYRVTLKLVPNDHLRLLLNLESTFVTSDADAAGTLPFWLWLPLTSCDAPYLPCQFLLPDMLPPPPGPLVYLYQAVSWNQHSHLLFPHLLTSH